MPAQPNSPDINSRSSLPVHALRPGEIEHFLTDLNETEAAYLRAQDFSGKAASVVLLPSPEGISRAVLGLGDHPGPATFGDLHKKLPNGIDWTLLPGSYDPGEAYLGITLGAYRFDRFRKPDAKLPHISVQNAPDRAKRLAEAVCFARDLVNMPANHLGPAELADAGEALARRHGARSRRIRGAELASGYPALHAVGAGSDRKPEILQFSWGENPSHPLISLCGKGVCFDSGGYDLKPSAAMLRMKKDMGGAAITLGVAQAIMALDLPVRLEVRIGCVENSVSGHAMRPLDVLATRAGLTVEVGNTDAEGRLVLADLLTDAADAKPDWLIDFATLTGAARVALGPELPALFANDDRLADALIASGTAAHDPLWQLPLWHGYESWLHSKIADMNTVAPKPFSGAIVAALFLKRFVPAGIAWAHIDTYAWNDSTTPGKPEGGEAQSLMATVGAIEYLASISVSERS
ncbi:MAG TPA: leucyl aminopeptidase family protein [Acidiphilium sp.]|nr:leucyl aminopeptidase family protein [Acidiphilium sp.]